MAFAPTALRIVTVTRQRTPVRLISTTTTTTTRPITLLRLPPTKLLFLSLAATAPSHHHQHAASSFSTSSNIIMPPRKPSLPLRIEVSEKIHLDLKDLSTTINDAAVRRQSSYDTSRLMKVALVRIRESIGQENAAAELQSFLTTFQLPQDRQSVRTTEREANLSYRVSDAVQLAAYHHFLETGTLIPPLPWATDEEYLMGACMGLAQDLSHYGLGRATVRDVASVQAACDLVTAILDYLLEFDFRNGNLRRKYDGTKYSLKALETLLYELAVTSPASSTATSRLDCSLEEKLLPHEELQALHARMVRRDELREELIKKCRDGQKAAKQSIYALHRGDRTKAEQLLKECVAILQNQLLPIVQEEPALRTGSFANLVEEYVEAKLFAAWLHGDGSTTDSVEEGDVQNGNNSKPSCVLLHPDFFAQDILPLEPDEYIGGLCDLTGEIGRYAVHRGTERDVESVKLCLQTNSEIMKAVEVMEQTPGVNKKVDALRSSVSKIERMLYELSLSVAAGGRNVASHVEDMEKE